MQAWSSSIPWLPAVVGFLLGSGFLKLVSYFFAHHHGSELEEIDIGKKGIYISRYIYISIPIQIHNYLFIVLFCFVCISLSFLPKISNSKNKIMEKNLRLISGILRVVAIAIAIPAVLHWQTSNSNSDREEKKEKEQEKEKEKKQQLWNQLEDQLAHEPEGRSYSVN